MKEFYRAILVLAIPFYFCACKSNSTSTNPAVPVHPVSPAVGSSFLYYSVRLDSIGDMIAVDSSTLYGDTVLAVGISQFGKTNVTQFTPNFLFQYVNYEANGNISYYKTPAAGQTGEWIAVPMDSMGTYASMNPDPTTSTWYTYTGPDEMNLAGRLFNAESFDIYSGLTLKGIQGIAVKEWYDTATGILLEQHTLATRDTAGRFGTGSGYVTAKFNGK